MTSNSDLAEHDGTAGQEGKGPSAQAEMLRDLLRLSDLLRYHRIMMLDVSRDLIREYPGISRDLREEADRTAEVLKRHGTMSGKPTTGPPAAPSPVLEGKDPGEPQPPSVSAEHEVALEIWRAPGWAAKEGAVRAYGDKRAAAAYARGLERAAQIALMHGDGLSGEELAEAMRGEARALAGAEAQPQQEEKSE